MVEESENMMDRRGKVMRSNTEESDVFFLAVELKMMKKVRK